jgi:F0F1-type ATP synthase membrane subunit b/b'
MYINKEISTMSTAELLDVLKEIAEEPYSELQDAADAKGDQLEVSRPLYISDLIQDALSNTPPVPTFALEVLEELYTRAGYEEMDIDSLDETLSIEEVHDILRNKLSKRTASSLDLTGKVQKLVNEVRQHVERLAYVENGIRTISDTHAIQGLVEEIYTMLNEAGNDSMLLDSLPTRDTMYESELLNKAQAAVTDIKEYYEKVLEDLVAHVAGSTHITSSVRGLVNDILNRSGMRGVQ